ncbi:extracellular solute-binding protein [Acetobacterium paludosum]|uniref:Extracellular solute-binding protein n=1 Tax=Acetobacterium paludosum TaxID=52693 RepID=A0A923KX05_9FIRM|nr:ABC transporter substrate-binding protein [Acetobacterium paludosum]MBC3887796.1 extracellular solute-binding protein [Acetobacterium paludosum]
MTTKKRFAKLTALLLSLFLLFTVTACSNGNNKTTDASTTSNTAWTKNYKESMKGTTINLYGVTDAIIPVLDAFTADTGIKVANLTLQNGEILQRIKNEKDSGTVVADVWFTGGADTFINASESGYLEKYTSVEDANIPSEMKDANGYWYGTSLTIVNWVVNKDMIAELGIQMPTKWDDLLQPQLAGLVSMPDPASSGTAYNTVSAILQTRGDATGWAYLDKLIQQVPYFTARGSDPANNVIAGEAAIGINAGTGDKSLEVNNPQVSIVYPTDGTGWWPQPVAILAGCKHPDEAKVFEDWLLSKRGLEEVAKAQKALVVRDDVTVPDGLLALADIKLFPTDFKANATQRVDILAKWNEKVSQK